MPSLDCVPVNAGREHGPFKLFSFEVKVGVRRADYIRIGTESSDNRGATGDAWRREGSGEGNILCDRRFR